MNCTCGHSCTEHRQGSRYFDSSACFKCRCTAYDDSGEVTEVVPRREKLTTPPAPTSPKKGKQ